MNKQLRKAFVYRLEPTDEQELMFLEYSKASRFVFNWGLAQIKEIFDKNKKPKPDNPETATGSDIATEAEIATGSNIATDLTIEATSICKATEVKEEATDVLLVSDDKATILCNKATDVLVEKQKLPTYFDFTSGGLTALKKVETWLNTTPCHTLQASYKDLDLAMKAFFRRIKAKEPKAGFPRFKNRYQDHAFRFPDPVKMHAITETHIRLPKIGYVRYRRGKYYEKRPISGLIKTMTVKKDGKHWYISLSCLIDRTVYEAPEANGIQLDCEVVDNRVNFLLDDSINIAILPSPNYYQHQMDRLGSVQKALSKKVKGSANRQKCIDRLTTMHIHIKNQRKDFLHKLSTSLVNKYDVITVKAKPIKEMMKNEQFALALGDAGWYGFVLMLKNKCAWFGKHYKEI